MESGKSRSKRVSYKWRGGMKVGQSVLCTVNKVLYMVKGPNQGLTCKGPHVMNMT